MSKNNRILELVKSYRPENIRKAKRQKRINRLKDFLLDWSPYIISGISGISVIITLIK